MTGSTYVRYRAVVYMNKRELFHVKNNLLSDVLAKIPVRDFKKKKILPLKLTYSVNQTL